MTKRKAGFDKYKYYERSVQNPEFEVEFINDQYKKIRKKSPLILREDFCGTGALMCEWVKQGKKQEAYGIDLDKEPIRYGKENHYARLNADEQSRVHYINGNVLSTSAEKADVIVGFNFSYFILKERKELLKYFKQVKKGLKKKGLFFLDLFGGPESQTLLEEETEFDNFSYFWDCQSFNPLTHDCRFAIHFKDEKGKKHENAFVYNWRFWTLPELKDLLLEAGFSEVKTFWEEDDEDEDEDGGNGVFYETNKVENCEAWVTYIIAIP